MKKEERSKTAELRFYVVDIPSTKERWKYCVCDRSKPVGQRTIAKFIEKDPTTTTRRPDPQVAGPTPKLYRNGVSATSTTDTSITGPLLTLAIGEWYFPGLSRNHRISDVATRMRLADLLSHHHDMEVNADRRYGPRGRITSVGRHAGIVRVG